MLPSHFKRRSVLVLALCAAALLLAGCYTGPGYDPYGPRNSEGLLVDPRTGITLPGQDDYCPLQWAVLVPVPR